MSLNRRLLVTPPEATTPGIARTLSSPPNNLHHADTGGNSTVLTGYPMPVQANIDGEDEPSKFLATAIHLDKNFTDAIAEALPRDKSISRLYNRMLARYKDSPTDNRISIARRQAQLHGIEIHGEAHTQQ